MPLFNKYEDWLYRKVADETVNKHYFPASFLCGNGNIGKKISYLHHRKHANALARVQILSHSSDVALFPLCVMWCGCVFCIVQIYPEDENKISARRENVGQKPR
ncbi:MAG: hypothetical protein LBH80_05725 [Prevotellaceae bacterium]|jgi:hypothetical protein|nr:hypothetical protein [Prevotellaceae bacterium]